MPEQHPQEFHDAATAAIILARDPVLFNHLAGLERDGALREHVADAIGRCVAPWMTRHIKAMSERLDATHAIGFREGVIEAQKRMPQKEGAA